VDGNSTRAICRTWRQNNVQYPFWNRYYHAHCLIYLGFSFPDGMAILEPPFPGYFTDIMCWRDCTIRYQLDDIMAERVLLGMPPL